MKRRAQMRIFAGTSVLVLAVAGCSSPPNSAPSSSGNSSGGNTSIAKPYQDLMNLSEADLVKAAKKEGSLTVYTGQNAAKIDPLVKGFESKYGIKVTMYHADSGTVLQRVDQEAGANKTVNDVLDLDGAQMVEAASQGLLSPYTRPARNGVPKDEQFPDWTTSHLLVYAPSWNTKNVSAAEAPKSWAELADPKWHGKVALEVTDSLWYFALKTWLMKSGKSQSQADQIMKGIAKNSRTVKGHTTMIQLLGAGEFEVAATPYINAVRELKSKGGPVAYLPAVDPVFVVPSGPGLMTKPKHPAAALLWMDFDLGQQGQTLLRTKGFVDPALPAEQTPDFKQLKQVVVDLPGYLKDSKKWDDAYQQLLTGASK